MAATVQDLIEAASAARCTTVSIHFPQREGDEWRVAARNGPEWVVGEYEPTLIGALQNACGKLVQSRPIRPTDTGGDIHDDLADLLG